MGRCLVKISVPLKGKTVPTQHNTVVRITFLRLARSRQAASKRAKSTFRPPKKVLAAKKWAKARHLYVCGARYLQDTRRTHAHTHTRIHNHNTVQILVVCMRGTTQNHSRWPVVGVNNNSVVIIDYDDALCCCLFCSSKKQPPIKTL